MSDRAKQLLDDITTLEVNTIINRNISAQKMPRPRFAMHKIAAGYHRYLLELNLNLDIQLPEIHSHKSTFEQLASYSEKAIEALEPGTTEAEHIDFDHKSVLLTRIKNNSEEIINLVTQAAPQSDAFFDKNKLELTSPANLYLLQAIPFETDQLVRLRKINEIGTETVAMQTCIQLDGDVVTRINPKYAVAAPISEQIQKIHGEGLQISIQRWQDIVSAIGAFFKAVSSLR